MHRPLCAGKDQTVRCRWHIGGQVQGVGFRPFVYRLARRFHLSGFVRNDDRGVTIEAQGTAAQIDHFAAALAVQQPPLARAQHVVRKNIPLNNDRDGFVIRRSGAGLRPAAGVTVDTATCQDCLEELNNPSDRRFRYGLINCTNCGPRYSIIRGVPYDRSNTTMARFGMCAACRDEYTDSSDRRFHAQPIACHDCGPCVELVDTVGQRLEGDPVGQAVTRLVRGEVVAIKGLGGFHLAVRCDLLEAVSRLRRLKGRDAKPFAVMCPTVHQAQRLVCLSDWAIELMRSPVCPIVLAPRRLDAAVAHAVAPQNHRIGVMLPSTPLHHLLFAGGGVGPLVMTSANGTDEPLVVDNLEAVRRLGDVCDAILWHDRPIARGVDDSVFIDTGWGVPMPVRRARGMVPGALRLPRAASSSGLCVGGELKNTVGIVREGQVVLSQHLGNLSHPMALGQFKKTIEDLCGLLGARPRWIACDLHPAYLSSVYARERATELGVPVIGVQHHHAHAAAVMAEHGVHDPVLAVVCDGVGYGADGSAWGGELLMADLLGFRRLARLRPLMLPGGDAAAKDTRRCGLALLYQALGDGFEKDPAAESLVDGSSGQGMLVGMIRRGVRCVATSSTGRVFDGVAALLGLCQHNTYEAQAGIALEAAASEARPQDVEDRMFFSIHDDPEVGEGLRQIDLSKFVRYLLASRRRGRSVADLAALFHEQLAAAWAAAVDEAVGRTGIGRVALSGGVFCNQRFAQRLNKHLVQRGLTVLQHRLVPPNDGSLALGQAAVASATLAADKTATMNQCAFPETVNTPVAMRV